MLMLAGWQKHSMDDSIIKKIYSAERVHVDDDPDSDDEEEKKKESTIDANALMDGADKDPEAGEDGNKELTEAILERERFKYSYKRSWIIQRFTSPLCCCCRVKPTR